MKKLIGITGATGLIGKKVVDRLIKKGYRVRILIRNKAKNIWDERVEVILGDVTNKKDIARLVIGCEAVIHLAVTMDLNLSYDIFDQINVQSCKYLIEEAELKKVKLVMVSTVMVFEPTGSIPRDENWSKRRGYHSSHYVRSKTEAWYLTNNQDYPVITVYPSMVFDKEMIDKWKLDHRDGLVQWLWTKVGGGIPGGLMAAIGPGKRMMNIVEVNEVAEGIILAMENGKSGQDYLLTGENIAAASFLKRISLATNKKAAKFRIPIWTVSLANKLFKLNIGIPEDMCFSNQKAKKEIGYQPTWKL